MFQYGTKWLNQPLRRRICTASSFLQIIIVTTLWLLLHLFGWRKPFSPENPPQPSRFAIPLPVPPCSSYTRIQLFNFLFNVSVFSEHVPNFFPQLWLVLKWLIFFFIKKWFFLALICVLQLQSIWEKLVGW